MILSVLSLLFKHVRAVRVSFNHYRLYQVICLLSLYSYVYYLEFLRAGYILELNSSPSIQPTQLQLGCHQPRLFNLEANMEIVVFLRGITPSGKNRIAKMSRLCDVLTEVGFRNVRSYIQSGNLVLETDLSLEETAELIRTTIQTRLGPELKVLLRHKSQLQTIIDECPFEVTNPSLIHIALFEGEITPESVDYLFSHDLKNEQVHVGSEAIYVLTESESSILKCNTIFFERKMKIVATMRRYNVVKTMITL